VVKWSKWSQKHREVEQISQKGKSNGWIANNQKAAWNANQLESSSIQKMFQISVRMVWTTARQGGTTFTSKSGACAVLLRHQPFQLEIFRDGLLLQTFNARPAVWRRDNCIRGSNCVKLQIRPDPFEIGGLMIDGSKQLYNFQWPKPPEPQLE